MATRLETSSPAQTTIVYPAVPWQERGGIMGAIRLFGPGAIIASVTIASGEILFSSRAGALFGYGLLWFVALCVGCKLVQVYTAARYMILTGEHPMEAWVRLPGPRGWFPIFLGGLSIMSFPFWLGGLALMLGGAINWIIGLDSRPPDVQQFSLQIFGSAALVLAAFLTVWQSYKTLEIVQTTIIALLLAGVVIGVGLADVHWLEAGRGLFAIKVPEYESWVKQSYPDIVAQQTVVIVMVLFMGAIGGGTYDYLGYLSFFREKGWGAIAREGEPRAEQSGLAAPLIATDAVNLRRGRAWLRAPLIDVFSGFACVIIFTASFNLLGAAILNPKHLVPSKFALLTPQAEFLTQFGVGFKYVYQAGVFMAFWKTIYGAMEVYSRTAYECLRPMVKAVRYTPYSRFRLPVCLYTAGGAMLLLWTVQDPIKIMEPAALISTITCGIWCFAMIWADRRCLPRALQMNLIWVMLNLLAGIAMIGLGVLGTVHYFS